MSLLLWSKASTYSIPRNGSFVHHSFALGAFVPHSCALGAFVSHSCALGAFVPHSCALDAFVPHGCVLDAFVPHSCARDACGTSPLFHKLYFCCLGKHSQSETSFKTYTTQ